jgi:hypothetical protein
MIAAGQNQIATAMSIGPFRLRGATITPGQGVTSWPVISGDVIRSGESPVTIEFPDGSTITLAPASSARLDLVGDTPSFRLEAGTAHYALKTVDSVKLVAGTNSVVPSTVLGDLQLGATRLPAGWWTAGHTTLVLGVAGGATAAAVGVIQGTTSKGN